eukprot:scaffold1445_cov235-Pinguiococcus_pyrenoidosus.AAC.2
MSFSEINRLHTTLDTLSCNTKDVDPLFKELHLDEESFQDIIVVHLLYVYSPILGMFDDMRGKLEHQDQTLEYLLVYAISMVELLQRDDLTFEELAAALRLEYAYRENSIPYTGTCLSFHTNSTSVSMLRTVDLCNMIGNKVRVTSVFGSPHLLEHVPYAGSVLLAWVNHHPETIHIEEFTEDKHEAFDAFLDKTIASYPSEPFLDMSEVLCRVWNI